MTLTSEQQRCWDALHGAQFHCHEMAKDILAVKGRAKRFHQCIDRHLETIMHLYTGDEVIRIVHTWLKVYKIPIDPSQLINYDLFHARYGSLVMAQTGKKIKPY